MCVLVREGRKHLDVLALLAPARLEAVVRVDERREQQRRRDAERRKRQQRAEQLDLQQEGNVDEARVQHGGDLLGGRAGRGGGGGGELGRARHVRPRRGGGRRDATCGGRRDAAQGGADA